MVHFGFKTFFKCRRQIYIFLFISLEDDGNLLKVRTFSPRAIDEWKQQVLHKVKRFYCVLMQPMTIITAFLVFIFRMISVKTCHESFTSCTEQLLFYYPNICFFWQIWNTRQDTLLDSITPQGRLVISLWFSVSEKLWKICSSVEAQRHGSHWM